MTDNASDMTAAFKLHLPTFNDDPVIQERNLQTEQVCRNRNRNRITNPSSELHLHE